MIYKRGLDINMNIYDYEFDETEVAIWETIDSLERLDRIQDGVDKEFKEAKAGLKKLQEMLLKSGGFETKEER